MSAAAPLLEGIEEAILVGLRKAIEATDARAKSEEAVPCIREWLLQGGPPSYTLPLQTPRIASSVGPGP